MRSYRGYLGINSGGVVVVRGVGEPVALAYSLAIRGR